MEDPRDRTERDLAEYEEFVEYEPRGLSLLDLMLVLARRKSMIIKITMLFAVGSIIASLLMTKLYVGSARILNPVEKSSAMSLLEQQAGSVAGLFFAGSEKGNVYVSMLQSRNVRDRVLDRFAPKNWRELAGPGKEMGMGDLVSEHIGTLTVTAEKDNTLLVSVEYTDQGKVADIANAYVDEMEKLANEFAMTEATKRLNYFEGELANARMSLTRTEQLFREYQEKTGVYMGEAQLTANIQNRINMRAQVAAKEIQLRSLLSYATRQNPEVVKLEKEISGLKEEIKRLEDDPGTGDPLNPLGGMPAARFEYLEKYRDWKFQEVLYNTLLRLYETARLDQSYSPVVIQVLDRAEMPENRSKPKRKMIVVLATFLGFFLAVFLAFVAEAWKRAAEDPEQAEKVEEFRGHVMFWRRSRKEQAAKE